MVGFALERSGSQLRDDPERPIESYPRDRLTTGPARDYAAAVLGPMITGTGTKEPRDL